ncbi:MAG: lysylphosphatidylglycerol synthase transmembrane domain-containing protein [Saprospiraceae bacterium]
MRRKQLIWVGKVLLLTLIVGILARKIDFQALAHLLRTADPAGLFWAAVWFVFSKIIAAHRFRMLYQAEGGAISSRDNLRLYWVGMYYNLLLPGGVSGDGYKIKVLSDRSGLSLKRLVWVALLDRISGAAALARLLLIMLCFIPISTVWSALWIGGLVLSFPIERQIYRKVGRGMYDVWVKIALWAFPVQIAQSVSALGLIYSLGGWNDYLVYSALFLASSIAAMTPLTIGGAGARELTFLYGAGLFGLQAEKAVGIAFIFYVLSSLIAFTGVFWSFRATVFANDGKDFYGDN